MAKIVPIFTTGHDYEMDQLGTRTMRVCVHTFLHSCAHRFGLQRLESTMAIRVILSAMVDDSVETE